MIDKSSFRALYCAEQRSLEYEITDKWLDENVFPSMQEAAKNSEFSYEFIVNVDEIDPSSLRKVLETKGYGVLWWPVAYQTGFPMKRMKIRVLW